MASSAAYVDPGSAKDCAVSFFLVNTCVGLGWLGPDGLYRAASGTAIAPPAEILWEKPESYPGARINPNKLLELAVAGAVAAERLSGGRSTVRSILPRQWKGQIAKCAHHWQLWQLLTESERALFPITTEQYVRAAAYEYATTKKEPAYSASVVDLLDACALGCYDSGRLPGPIAGKVARPSIKRARAQYRKK